MADYAEDFMPKGHTELERYNGFIISESRGRFFALNPNRIVNGHYTGDRIGFTDLGTAKAFTEWTQVAA